MARASQAGNLRRLLRERLDVTTKQALAANGEVDEEELHRLDSLSKLCALAEAEHPRKRNHLLVAVVLLLALTLVSVLLFTHERRTVVELQADVSEFTFSTKHPAELNDGWRLAAITAVNFDRLETRELGSLPEGSISGEEGALLIETLPDEKTPGSVTLDALSVEPDAIISVSRKREGQYHLTIRMDRESTKELKAEFSASGRLRVAAPRIARFESTATVPVPFVAYARKKALDLDISLRPGESLAFGRLIPVDQLSLLQVQSLGSGLKAAPRQISSVLAGSLYFSSLNGKAYKLREAEELRLNSVDGNLVSVLLTASQATLRFDGTASNLTTGSPPYARTLMPTWLEWLRAQEPLALLWGTTLSLVGVALGLLRWLKVDV